MIEESEYVVPLLSIEHLAILHTRCECAHTTIGSPTSLQGALWSLIVPFLSHLANGVFYKTSLRWRHRIPATPLKAACRGPKEIVALYCKAAISVMCWLVLDVCGGQLWNAWLPHEMSIASCFSRQRVSTL
jgi:hypothetical protein